MRFDVVEATALRDVAFRVPLRLVEALFEEEDLAVLGLLKRLFSGAGLALRALAETFRFRLVDDVFFAAEAVEELFTKRTGFFAREAVVEEGFRFFDDAMVRYSSLHFGRSHPPAPPRATARFGFWGLSRSRLRWQTLASGSLPAMGRGDFRTHRAARFRPGVRYA